MSRQVETAPVAVLEGDETVVATVTQQPVVDRGLVAQLVGEAQRQGLSVDGEGGLLAELTRLVLESALEAGLAAGYFDQPQMARDFRRFLGCTATEWAREQMELARQLASQTYKPDA